MLFDGNDIAKVDRTDRLIVGAANDDAVIQDQVPIPHAFRRHRARIRSGPLKGDGIIREDATLFVPDGLVVEEMKIITWHERRNARRANSAPTGCVSSYLVSSLAADATFSRRFVATHKAVISSTAV